MVICCAVNHSTGPPTAMAAVTLLVTLSAALHPPQLGVRLSLPLPLRAAVRLQDAGTPETNVEDVAAEEPEPEVKLR